MKKILVLLLSILMVLSLAACGGKDEDPEPGTTGEPGSKYGGVLRYASGNFPTTSGYTPEMNNNAALLFLNTAYESLVTYSNEGLIVGSLAKEWETDPDEMSITWTLREGVKFADGEPFNAAAVVRNIEEYQKVARNEVASIESMEVIDDTHVKMYLNQQPGPCVTTIGFYVYYVSPKALEDIDSLRLSSCGTGPFQVTSFDPGVKIVYAKNENYWQEGKPYLDGVEITNVAESATLASAFKNGEYDMVNVANLAVASDLIALGSTDVGEFVLEMNTNGQGLISAGAIPNSVKEGPFQDARVRRAMALAIDSESLCAAYGYGIYTPTYQWGTPDSPVYNKDINVLDYDPETAKSLLAEAGYPNGFDTTIYVGPYVVDFFTAAAAMLDEVGIHAEIQMIDNATEASMMTSGEWDGIMCHSATISPDLGIYMGRHLDYNGTYYAKGIIHPDDHMKLLDEIRNASDEETKIDLEQQLNGLIYNKENGSAIFGKPIFIVNYANFKYDYVKDDGRSIPEANIWTIADCYFEK